MVRNVFVLSADSLQQGYFDTALSQIADQIEGVAFTNAVSTATHTLSAMPGLAAGVYHDSLPERSPKPSRRDDPDLLAERLTDNGYEAGLWTENYLFGEDYNYDRGFTGGSRGEPTLKKQAASFVKNSPLRPAFGLLEWGYFNVYQRAVNVVSGSGGYYRKAETLHAEALDWLEQTDGPTACWIHYMDTHHPFEPPTEYLEAESFNTNRTSSELGQFSREAIKSNGEGLSPEDVEDIQAAYRACCNHLADAITEFITKLKARGEFDPNRDVLVFTADHGECLRPKKFDAMGHTPPSFWEGIINVPLVISRPDWESQTLNEQVSLIDVMPTVLDAVGVPVPETAEGRACSSPSEMVREYAIVESQAYRFHEDTKATYRAIRHESGVKLFGANRHPDEIVLSRYRAGSPETESIEHTATTLDDEPSDDDLAETWRRLARELQQRGDPIQITPNSQTEQTEIDEEHLKDLGYLE